MLIVAAALLAGCASFTLETPPGMIELKEQGTYAYRAMTPDGVVLGIRVVDDAQKTDVAFWVEAVTLHMKELSGYALLTTADVSTADAPRARRPVASATAPMATTDRRTARPHHSGPCTRRATP